MVHGPNVVQAVPAALQSRYRIGEVLGVGGMSTVYAAHDPLLQRDVAIKVFRARATASADLRTQEMEARVVASLNHYALTTLFDAGVDTADPEQPQVYLVMEYIPGADLRARIAERPLTASQVCWLGFDLAEALDYVHESGFLHRDIKPANILVADRNSDVRIRGKLTDFGIAALVGQVDMSEFTTGTAAYLSPEVVEGDDAIPASDIYSLGLVLLEALTGEVAYPGGIEASAFARLDRQPAIPTTIPKDLAALLAAMTARDPAERPALRSIAERFGALLIDQLVAVRGADSQVVARELDRIAAVQKYNILDTPADDAFDTVTRLAAQMLHVPIAIVTIIDSDRVWFKSRRGIQLDEVDRNTAFCSTTYSGDGLAWTIPDALADARLTDNLLVTGDPHVRSYAAAPLVTQDGHQLGALCIFDTEPRDFDRQELENLTDLASIVMRELELRLASRRAIFDR